MTIERVGGANLHLQGLSSDDKPLEDILPGATFHAIDTGETFIFHDGAWHQDLRQIYAQRALY